MNDGDRKEVIVQAASADEVVLGDENLDQFTSLVELDDDDTAAVERDQEASEKELLKGAALYGGYGPGRRRSFESAFDRGAGIRRKVTS